MYIFVNVVYFQDNWIFFVGYLGFCWFKICVFFLGLFVFGLCCLFVCLILKSVGRVVC